jgi:hypothetical protein
MVVPSLSAIELQLLVSIIAVLIFFGSFLALLFSAVFGLVLRDFFTSVAAGAWGSRLLAR